MKTKLPTNIRIRNFEYVIDYVGHEREVAENLAQTDLLGQLCPGKPGHIRILTTQQPIGILDTLIHEILHGLFHRNTLLTAAIKPEIGEEAFIGALSLELAALLIENNWVQMPAHVQPTVRRITKA